MADASMLNKSWETGRDRISALPDEILCYILSFIPTKYAVGTSILSQRWKFLWTYAPNLDFDDEQLFSTALTEVEVPFLNFVERVLSCHSDMSCVQKFGLRCLGIYSVSRICKLISTALMPNVEDLHLDICIGSRVDLPKSIYDSCGNLQTLKLTGDIIINAPPSVLFSSLKILRLTLVKFMYADSLKKLLAGCPILEDLYIHGFKYIGDAIHRYNSVDMMWTFYVCSPSLKNLEMHDDVPTHLPFSILSRVILETPNLEHLKLRDHTERVYNVNELSSLVSANVDFKRPRQVSSLLELLNKISHIEELQLSNYTVDILEDCEYDELPLFHNLTHLIVGISKGGKPIVPYLLERSPKLTSLKLEKVYGQPCEDSK